jgi:SAM-dependent methyltransferase
MSTTRPVTEELHGEDWAGAMGDNWLANLQRFEGMIEPVGMAFLEHAAFAPGETVVDVGCGAGGTSLSIARQVGPDGRVVGVDISPALVAHARERGAGMGQLSFECADAAVASPVGAPFERLFSRFGTMFFANPAAAFANLHGLLHSGGRIDLAVWAPPADNEWVAGLMAIFARYVELPRPVPRAPGPFALADQDYCRSLLTDAGFREITFTPWSGLQCLGGAGATAVEAAEFVMSSMSFAKMLAADDAVLREKVTAELTDWLEAHVTTRGVELRGKAWLVSGRAG